MNFNAHFVSTFTSPNPLLACHFSSFTPEGESQHSSIHRTRSSLAELASVLPTYLAFMDDVAFLQTHKALLCPEDLAAISTILNYSVLKTPRDLRASLLPFLTSVRARLSDTNAASSTPPTSSTETTTVPPSPPAPSSPLPSASN